MSAVPVKKESAADKQKAAKLEHLKQIQTNLKDKIENRIPTWPEERRAESISRTKEQLDQVEAEIAALQKPQL